MKVRWHREYESFSPEETIQVGRELGRNIASSTSRPGLLILRGDLGAGKTTLVKGIAEGLGVARAEEITSPTFTLVHEFEAKAPRAAKLFHLDVYRLEEERELFPLGLDEMIDSGATVLVEWGEKFPELMLWADGEIRLSRGDEGERRIVAFWRLPQDL